MARKKAVKQTEPTSRFAQSYDTLKSKIAHNSERIKEVQTKARAKMAENPLQTAAIAFGIGVVAGVGLKVLLDSKRRD